MKTISVMNVKGGVGKTITAVNVAHILATEYDSRVLLIDADAQADATAMLYEDEPEETSGLYGAMVYGGVVDLYLDRTKYPGLDIVTASSDLFYISMGDSEAMTKTMSDFLENVSSEYDFCIVDCPPSFSAPSVAAICNSDAVVIPVKLDAFGLRACRFLVDQVEAMQEFNPHAKVAGALATMYHNCDVCNQALKLLSESGIHVFETKIRRTDKADESTFFQMALSEYSRHSSAGRDYRAFVSEFLEGGRSNGI